MKLPAIKKLVETYSLEDLRKGEEALLNEQTLPIEVEGEDEGEQLTHIIGAIEVLEKVEQGEDPKNALREFVQRVRNSIN